ncbi:MAG: polysaccharide deacetylase family protein [Verrucomicrobiota bacterium]|nr:polysaccharide deacetylase family protein [Verrucomicrobiota bacterium]
MWLLLILNLTAKVGSLFLGLSSPGTTLALWIVPDALLAYHIFVPRSQGVAQMYRRFVTSGHEVWLTIDDGPDPDDTPQILALLASHGAKATFFVIGRKADAYPELIRAIAAAGHEVAHHSYTHPLKTFWCISRKKLRLEIEHGLEALAAAGVRPTRFRPPATIKNLWLGPILAEHGLVLVSWSARGLESRCHSPEEVTAHVSHKLRPGAILLLHEGPGVPHVIRVHAIRKVLELLETQGYRCVIPKTSQLIT